MKFSFLLWIKSLAAFLRRAPMTYAGHWTEDNRLALATFMASNTGRALKRQLLAQISAANERAAISGGDPIIAGWAQGYRALVGTLDAFAELPTAHEMAETTAAGRNTVPPAADQYAP
jgi:hypothetical protein